ncbi:hypothetical protein O181_070165 [Austropuccinia psidii MF-1]|uniref:DUF1279 domain-containing protein n=1 Tax=Austropuccinia psidii MF-1 TaxID=1389203 RepID=A0A9Q3F4A2_9BASI|nr:hypothetical protein [Austropuccinia psidii MF-1]
MAKFISLQSPIVYRYPSCYLNRRGLLPPSNSVIHSNSPLKISSQHRHHPSANQLTKMFSHANPNLYQNSQSNASRLRSIVNSTPPYSSTYFIDHHYRSLSTNPPPDHKLKIDDIVEERGKEPKVGLFGKLRQLSKLYGSAALIVYALLSAADFGLSFLMIYLIGAEHVRTAEDWLLSQLNWKRAASTSPSSETLSTITTSTSDLSESNFLWTTALVAYTIHKTILLPVRIGLTAWITPPIVRALRKRGWKIGKNLN